MNPARRRLVIAAAALPAASSLPAIAQPPPRLRRIGWLSPVRARPPLPYDTEFLPGMRELGYRENRDFVTEFRIADGYYERLPAFAEELVRMNVNLVLATASNATQAAQRASQDIPIVFVSVSDPVGSRIVASLSRPGGNTTGIANFTGDLVSKHLELLSSMLPRLSRVAVLVNLQNPSNARILGQARAAAAIRKVQVLPAHAGTAEEIDRAFAEALRARADAFIVASDPYFYRQAAQIAGLALASRLPSVFALRQHVEAGGLVSYGDDVFKIYRRAASYVDRVFKGANPGELPIEPPVDFELAVNTRTAAALGLTIPESLLLRADRVIS